MRGLLFSLLLVPTAASAALSPGSGRTGANFLRIGIGPRAAGMGEAFTGLADDVNAVGYNPAGLALLSRQELTFMHNEYFSGVRQEWTAYALPMGRHGTAALSANLVQVEAFEGFDQNDQPTAKTSASDSAYGLAYGGRLGPVSLGGKVQFIRSRLDQSRASAKAFDAGLLYDTPLDGLRAGMAVQNWGGKVRYISENYDLPKVVRAGASYKPYGSRAREGRDLTFAADMVAYGDEDPFVSVGAEYLWSDIVAFRTGWRSDHESGSGLSLGMGLYFNHGGQSSMPELIFDYAFVDFGILSHVHRAAITLKFGKATGRGRGHHFSGVPHDSTEVASPMTERVSPGRGARRDSSDGPRRLREPEALPAEPEPAPEPLEKKTPRPEEDFWVR